MKMITWNVQGLKNKYKQISEDVSAFDVVCLVETWHDPNETLLFDRFYVEKVSRRESSNRRYYGGVIVLLKCKSVSKYQRLSSKSENIIWVKVLFF